MAGLRVYRELLANRPLVRLLTGEFISGIGDWLYIVAIFVVIYSDTGSAALVGAFGAVRLLPYVLLSVPAGFIADRFDRRLVLLVSDLYRGSLMVVMAIVVLANGPTLALVVLAILAACGSAFFYPAMGAYLPALAHDERQLGPANSAWATIQNITFILGPAIAGLILAVGNVSTAFILNAASFIVIAVILWTLPPSIARDAKGATEAPAAETESPSAAVDATGGADAHPTGGTGTPAATATVAPATPKLPMRPLAGLGVVMLVGGFLGGGIQTITVVLAIDVLHAGEQANGYLNAAIGIGGLLGGIAAGALVLRRTLGMPLIVGAIITGVGCVALGLSTALPLALVAIAVLSAGALVIDIVMTTVFQRLVPDELRGRGTGVLMAASTLTGAVGAFLTPVLVTSVGSFETFATLGVLTVVSTFVGLAMIGGAADRVASPFEATIGRVIQLPLFAGVPASRLETAMQRMVQAPVAAGAVVVRQGDPADRFFIIQSGAFTVTQVRPGSDEPVVLRKLGPDEVFGELGLLNLAPRSATVTADTEGMLLELGSDDFLELVGASGPLRGRLLGLYSPATTSR